MAFGEDTRTYEQFRMGVMNALEIFGPGGSLHAVTSRTTFRFEDLKREKIACYVSIDFNNVKVLGPWSGLMQHMASYELVGMRNKTPVTFVLDEFCNAPLHTLPEILTLLRGYGVGVIMATQDLSDILRVYSKEALETIMAETDIKQFLGGVRNKTTLDTIAKLLVERTQVTPNFSLDPAGVRESMATAARPLLTSDEVRRQVGINRMYGRRRSLLPVEVRLLLGFAWVTRRGRWRMPRPPRFRRIAAYLLSGLIPPRSAAVLLAAGLAIWQLGFPYVLLDPASTVSRGAPHYGNCRYFGPKPFWRTGRPCPLILLKEDWN